MADDKGNKDKEAQKPSFPIKLKEDEVAMLQEIENDMVNLNNVITQCSDYLGKVKEIQTQMDQSTGAKASLSAMYQRIAGRLTKKYGLSQTGKYVIDTKEGVIKEK